MPNKKRKVVSPLEELKSSKIIKFTKENSAKDISEEKKEPEEKPDTDRKYMELISDQEEEDLEKSSEQDEVKSKQSDTTPKRSFLKKSKTLEKSQKKSGTLTKFLMKIDDQSSNNLNNDSNLNKLENEDCQNISVGEEEIGSPFQHTSPTNEEIEDTQIAEKPSTSQDSESDITMLSSDTEAQSELDMSKTSISEEKMIKTETPVTPKSDKEAKYKLKKLTPRQIEKKQEIIRKKEEKAKIKMVCHTIKTSILLFRYNIICCFNIIFMF